VGQLVDATHFPLLTLPTGWAGTTTITFAKNAWSIEATATGDKEGKVVVEGTVKEDGTYTASVTGTRVLNVGGSPMDLAGTITKAAPDQDATTTVTGSIVNPVQLADGVKIGANCVIANCAIERGAVIQAFTHIDGEKAGVTVGKNARVGPFARLRPGAQLGADVHIGNFVEVKNATLANGAKANHLAYLGDASVGERVNFAAGSITANYDGVNKHRTVIEADVQVGSNCVLVAPVTLGAGGTIGGGSTITKDTPAGALTVARGKQISVAGWKRPVKKP
jgi:bifunctional UDP-N-acetylglucosamine pyrophosphorylase/glucosamine-1-phosphate N-acetyltransferase